MSEERTVKDGFLDSVTKQIDTGNPPEVREAFERLVKEGHSETEAMHLLTAVLRSEMNKMIEQSRSFDDATYAELLKKLPHL